jgi:RNA polymerase sigma-70 factor, ECF subfamily
VTLEGITERILRMAAHTRNASPSITVSSHKHACDDTLLTAAQSGDAVAFGELSGRYSKRILYRLYRMLGTREEAEDVLQESLLKAFVHLSQFKARSSFSTWMTRIAINSALMALRKRRFRSEVSVDMAQDDCKTQQVWDIPDHSLGPEACYALGESREVLRKVTCRLSPRDRKVVELYHGDGYSLNEVANALGISAAAVKSRLMRARLFLRRSLVRSSRMPSFRYLLTDHGTPQPGLRFKSSQKFIATDRRCVACTRNRHD